MRPNHHGNFKVQHFQLFEQIKKDNCTPSSTMPHLPLHLFQRNAIECVQCLLTLMNTVIYANFSGLGVFDVIII